jgi:hypothetical protein
MSTTTTNHPAAHGQQASIDVGKVLALLDGELEEIDLDDWPMPEGIGYRYNRHGALDPQGTFTTAQLLRMGRRTWDDVELDIARAHVEYEQEDQAALDWLAYLTPDGHVPAELLERARHTPTCELLDRHREGLDWLATKAPQSYLVFAPGQAGSQRPARCEASPPWRWRR